MANSDDNYSMITKASAMGCMLQHNVGSDLYTIKTYTCTKKTHYDTLHKEKNKHPHRAKLTHSKYLSNDKQTPFHSVNNA